MQYETYRADTIVEALAKVKAQCGEDALIKSTRRVTPTGSTFARPFVEIVAAPAAPRSETSLGRLHASASARPRPAPGFANATSKASPLESQLEELNRIVEGLQAAHDPQSLAESILVACGLEAPLSQELSRDIAPTQQADRQELTRVLRGRVAACLERSPDLLESTEPRIIACVGPTGAGKTTTLAKLAARSRLAYTKRVGIVTLDTFRVGATGEWERYAQLLNMPLYTVATAQQAEAAIAELEHYDLILIDTPGNLSNVGVFRERTRSVLNALPDRALETLLVLPAWLRGRDALQAARQFADPKPTGLVVTKIDETERLGGALHTSIMQSTPIVYACDGPHVPNDIHALTPEQLTALAFSNATR